MNKINPGQMIKRNGEVAVAISHWDDEDLILIIPYAEKSVEHIWEYPVYTGACGYTNATIIPSNTEVEIIGKVQEEVRLSLAKAFFASLEGVEHEECVKERLGEKYPQSLEDCLNFSRIYRSIVRTFTQGIEDI